LVHIKVASRGTGAASVQPAEIRLRHADSPLQPEAISPKISRAKAHVRFSRYRAAQEAAPEGKLDLIKRLKQDVGLLPRFVSDSG
jgi:hypothetical protein